MKSRNARRYLHGADLRAGPKSQTLRTVEAIAYAKAIGKEMDMSIDGNPIKVPLGTTILEAADHWASASPRSVIIRISAWPGFAECAWWRSKGSERCRRRAATRSPPRSR